MRTWRPPPSDGFALVETILLGLLLAVPLIWTLMMLADLHRGALASGAAAREAGFDAARAATRASGDVAVRAAVERAFADHGLDPRDARVRWSAPAGTRSGAVEVEISYPVRVLQVPFLGSVGGPAVWLRAQHSAPVDRYGDAGATD